METAYVGYTLKSKSTNFMSILCQRESFFNMGLKRPPPFEQLKKIQDWYRSVYP